MPGTLHPKGFQASTFFSVVALCGMLSAFQAVAFKPPANEDSLKSTTLVTPFTFEPDSNVFVDQTHLKAGLLYDVQNQKIVWQKDMNKTYPIASLTKMMVALLTVEDIHAGKVHWNDQVAWTRDVF